MPRSKRRKLAILFALLTAAVIIIRETFFPADQRAFNVNDQSLGTLTSDTLTLTNRWGDHLALDDHRLVVPEDYDDTSGNHIEVAFGVMRTTAATPQPPIFFLVGGPGPSGIDVAKTAYGYFFEELAQRADVVLIDYRGAGASIPNLACPNSLALPTDITNDIEAQLIDAVAAACRECAEHLRAKGVHLSQYHALNMARDIDRIRDELGYDRITLYGYSFGTLLAQVYLREFPDRVDKVIMAGVESPDLALKSPLGVQSQFDRLDSLARQDLRLSRYVPDLVSLMHAVQDSLQQAPVFMKVPLMDAVSDDDGWLAHSIFTVVSWFRPNWEMTMGDFHMQMMMQEIIGDDTWLGALPVVYYQIATHRYRFIANRLRNFRRRHMPSGLLFTTALSTGFLPAREAAAREEDAHTVLSHEAISFGRGSQVREAWGIQSLGLSFLTPVRSDRPVLFIGGDLDGRTPLTNIDTLSGRFPNHQRLTIHGSSHHGLTGSVVRADILAFLQGDSIPFTETSRQFDFQPVIDCRYNLADSLYAVIQNEGIDQAVQQYERWRRLYHDTLDYVFDFGEVSLNDLGYRLLQHDQPNAAAAIFELNTRAYPNRFNPWDSYAEALLAVGDTVRAVANYRKSIELDFFNGNAHAALRRIVVPDAQLTKSNE